MIYHSQRKYDRDLGDNVHYARFQRESEENKAHAFLMSLQPAPAIIAVLGCMCIFAFGSATWWYSDITVGKFFIAYAAQVIVLVIFAALKVIRLWRTGSFWAIKHPGFTGFSQNLDDLNRLIRDDTVESTAETDPAESTSQSRNESSEPNVAITNDGNQRAGREEEEK
jgi:amino acid transporter